MITVEQRVFKRVYRMSMPGDGRSMWYTRDGVFDPIVPVLTAKGFVMHAYETQHWYALPNEVVFDLSTATEVPV